MPVSLSCVLFAVEGVGVGLNVLRSSCMSHPEFYKWRAVNSAHLVTLVRAGAKFENGALVERPDESTSGDTHAT
jgi:hypothetical protein